MLFSKLKMCTFHFQDARFPCLRHRPAHHRRFPQGPGAHPKEVRRGEEHLLGQLEAGARHLRQRKALHSQRPR